MACKTITGNRTKVCIADFKHPITIQYTVSTPATDPDFNVEATFVDILSTYAMIRTVRFVSNFQQFVDQVNTSDSADVDFFIRYTDVVDWTRSIWVLFENQRYDVAAVENIDEKNETVRIRCSTKGVAVVEANKR